MHCAAVARIKRSIFHQGASVAHPAIHVGSFFDLVASSRRIRAAAPHLVGAPPQLPSELLCRRGNAAAGATPNYSYSSVGHRKSCFARRQETRNAVSYETVVGKSECKNHRVRAKVPCQPQVDSSTCTQLMGTAVEEGMGKHVPEWTTQALSSCWAAGLKSATKGVQYSSDTCTGTALRPSPQRCENAALTFHWTCYPYHTTCRLLRFPVPRKRFLTIFLWECW